MEDARTACDNRDLERGFEILVNVYHNLIYRVAYAYFDNREDALDAAQETLYKVYNAVGNFKGDSKLSTWLYRITINQCHDMYRKASIRRTISYDDPKSDVVPEVKPDLDKILLEDALAKLPPKLKKR
jgi:RNA polymerase sigma factor (sigma-70 family)